MAAYELPELPYDYTARTLPGQHPATPTRYRIAMMLGERLRVGWAKVDEELVVRPFRETLMFLDCVYQHVMEEVQEAEAWAACMAEEFAEVEALAATLPEADRYLASQVFVD